MRRHQGVWVSLLVALPFFLGLAADGRPQASQARKLEIEEALAERYRLTLIGPGLLGLTGGRGSIRRAGNIVLLRRQGLDGSLDPDKPASYSIQKEQAELYRGGKDAPLAVGENLYVHSIQVGSDVITLGVLTSRQLSGPAGSGHLWAALSFFFPPETIAQGDLTTIYRALDQWLQPQGAFQPTQNAAVTAPVVAPEAAPVAAGPTELKPGMNREEVIAILGPPRRDVSFGQRTWLSYSGLVVVLEDGRLASVDRSGQPPAKVTIVSEPEGADVYLDGTFVSSTPATLELAAGDYQVSVRQSGYGDWTREVRVLAGSELTLRARLEK